MAEAFVDVAVDAVFRREAGRVLGTLIRLLGDFELAEESLQEAFEAALEHWPRNGEPENPRAWLVRVGHYKGIDRLRHQKRQQRTVEEFAVEALIQEAQQPGGSESEHEIDDDLLQLIFTCCHPALSLPSQVALTLRAVCGLPTTAVARAFLVTPETMAQRLVRTQQKIRLARIPYETPALAMLDERLDGVLAVIYLVFTEGYAGSSGPSLMSAELADEALRLARLVDSLLPGHAPVQGLLALMLLHRARHPARATPEGDIILLEHQDRSRWDQTLIAEGLALVERALRSPGRSQRLRRPGRDCRPACPSASLQRNRLAADRSAVRGAAAHPALASDRSQPRGRRFDGRWTSARLAAGRSPRRAGRT